MTPTRKVKRNLMYERFKSLVEEMYDDREERLLAAERRATRCRTIMTAMRAGRTDRCSRRVEHRSPQHRLPRLAAAIAPLAACRPRRRTPT